MEQETIKTVSITKKARKYVSKFFKKKFGKHYKFHTYAATEAAVDIANKIAKELKLSDEQREMLKLAGWFRFTGVIKDAQNYWTPSAEIAQEFLQSENYPPEKIEEVTRLIKSLGNERAKEDVLEEIIHDAGVAYRGRKRYSRRSELHRIQMEKLSESDIAVADWTDRELESLTDTVFYTQYAKDKYQSRLVENIKDQRKVKDKAMVTLVRKKTGKDLGRGVDTLYRSSYRTHINLSSIADGKSNMMISINTIILSAIITLVGTSFTISGKIDFEHIRFLLPILVLLLSTSISGVFAILSARPKVTSIHVDKDDLIERKRSILYFGNYINMKMSDFIDNMNVLKDDQEVLYDNMAIDLYYMGHVLDKKYRLLKYAYNTFMFGLIASVLTFMFFVIFSAKMS